MNVENIVEKLAMKVNQTYYPEKKQILDLILKFWLYSNFLNLNYIRTVEFKELALFLT